jgi:hypothetical protein
VEDGRLITSLRSAAVPLIIRVINLAGLAIVGLILVPAASVRASQVLVLLGALTLWMGFYWKFQHQPTVSALHLSVAFSLILWIVLCENIISIDNLLGSHVTSELNLGLRLKALAKNNLRNQDKIREGCCGDPLSWHYKPGSIYRSIFDCARCNSPLELLVDTTGYLNRQYEFIGDGKAVDMFVAGDSVLEGVGVPGIVDFLNELMPEKLWSLSANNYGPRQKVNALITYAIPQRPRFVVLEFYGNDVTDAIMTESCASTATFYCLFTKPERHRALLQYEPFASMVDRNKNRPGMFEELIGNSFTLAGTQHGVNVFKGMMKAIGTNPTFATLSQSSQGDRSPRRAWVTHPQITSVEDRDRLSATEVAFPGAAPEYAVLPGRLLEWVKTGFRLVFNQYDRLAEVISRMDSRPVVILLYNPTTYEIYRGTLVKPDPEIDVVAAYQRHIIRDYADRKGWQALDMTDPLKAEVLRRGLWIFGQYDYVHWSTEGTKLVASVLARELGHLEACASRNSAGPTSAAAC